MNDAYSPHTGEHIQTSDPAPWMGRAGVAPPVYNNQTHGCFWRGGPAWSVEVVEPAVVVPETVSAAQGTTALINAGLYAHVQSYVAAIVDPTQRALAEVALNRTTEWRRDSAFLNEAATALGLLPGDLDGLFIEAAGIQL